MTTKRGDVDGRWTDGKKKKKKTLGFDTELTGLKPFVCLACFIIHGPIERNRRGDSGDFNIKSPGRFVP